MMLEHSKLTTGAQMAALAGGFRNQQ